MENKKINSGPVEAIMGALMLGAFCKPKKKKVILTKMPKNEPRAIFNQSLKEIFLRLTFKIKGINRKDAKKNLIKAKVKGGILVRANLKIGEAAPQIALVIIKAKIGFMIISFYSNKQLIHQLSQSSRFEFQQLLTISPKEVPVYGKGEDRKKFFRLIKSEQ